jgi:hypothetical protein
MAAGMKIMAVAAFSAAGALAVGPPCSARADPQCDPSYLFCGTTTTQTDQQYMIRGAILLTGLLTVAIVVARDAPQHRRRAVMRKLFFLLAPLAVASAIALTPAPSAHAFVNCPVGLIPTYTGQCIPNPLLQQAAPPPPQQFPPCNSVDVRFCPEWWN